MLNFDVQAPFPDYEEEKFDFNDYSSILSSPLQLIPLDTSRFVEELFPHSVSLSPITTTLDYDENGKLKEIELLTSGNSTNSMSLTRQWSATGELRGNSKNVPFLPGGLAPQAKKQNEVRPVDWQAFFTRKYPVTLPQGTAPIHARS
jgi:hypothetical protein